jgi:hypothetical protein
MDRRTSIKWVLAASAAFPLLGQRFARADTPPASAGYGTDPNLLAPYHPGTYWPLTLTAGQRRIAAVLSDLIIPADEHSPSASSVGVVDFIDEWVSAPYPASLRDRPVVLGGFAWLDEEAKRRFGKLFVSASAAQQSALCDDICDARRADPRGARPRTSSWSTAISRPGASTPAPRAARTSTTSATCRSSTSQDHRPIC